MSKLQPVRMTADRFLAWAMDQPESKRYELASGEVVAMAPERAAHARAKRDVLQALGEAIATASLECEALPDGMLVQIDDVTVYEPDAAVRSGPPLPDDAIEYNDPQIVIEVLSPATRARDSGAKLEDYFRLRSIRHHLILKVDTRCVIHHERRSEDAIATSIRHAGMLRLHPPGIEIRTEDIFRNIHR